MNMMSVRPAIYSTPNHFSNTIYASTGHEVPILSNYNNSYRSTLRKNQTNANYLPFNKSNDLNTNSDVYDECNSLNLNDDIFNQENNHSLNNNEQAPDLPQRPSDFNTIYSPTLRNNNSNNKLINSRSSSVYSNLGQLNDNNGLQSFHKLLRENSVTSPQPRLFTKLSNYNS